MVKSIIIKTLKSHLIKITKQWMKKRTIHSWIGSFYPYRGKGLQNVKKLGGDKPMRWAQPAPTPMEIGLTYLPKIVGTSPHVPKRSCEPIPPYRGTSSWICHAPSRQKFLEKDEKSCHLPPKMCLSIWTWRLMWFRLWSSKWKCLDFCPLPPCGASKTLGSEIGPSQNGIC